MSDRLRLPRKFFRLAADRRFSYIAYVAHNRLRGLDFAVVSQEELALPPDRGNYHCNSGGPDLARVLKKIDIPPGTWALDLGSGKGGAALTMSRLGYEKVVGVEIVEDVVEIARANAVRARRANVEFVVADAGAFTEIDRFTHIYMFNPFPDNVMAQVLTNLARSLERHPRTLTLVYCNPVFHETIMESGLFVVAREFDARALYRYVIYVHQPTP